MGEHNNLIVLAGGASSRMKKPETQSSGLTQADIDQANQRSKGLIGVGAKGRPMLDYVLFNAKKAGYRNVYIVIGEQGELFREYYGKKDRNNIFQGLNISYAIQFIPLGRTKPLGTADALFQTVEQYPGLNGSSYSVCNSDNLYSAEALRALRLTQSPNALIGYDRDALDFDSNRISRFAIVKLDGEGHLLDIIEKPSIDNVEGYRDVHGKLRVSMNAFKFDGQKIYPYLKNCPIHTERNEKELPTALLNMLKDCPKTVLGIPFSEHVPDLTAKEDIVQVRDYLNSNYAELEWNS